MSDISTATFETGKHLVRLGEDLYLARRTNAWERNKSGIDASTPFPGRCDAQTLLDSERQVSLLSL